MKAGDTAKLTGIPPNLRHDAQLQTRTLFEKCLGQSFVIVALESIEGVPHPLAKLDVGHVIGQESWKQTIWVEPEYLTVTAEAYRVFVVLDRDYGGRVSDLAQTGPVWIVDTPLNRAAAQKMWAVNPNGSHLNGVTTFKFEEASSTEDILINQLGTIDLHHGTYSANPPYTVLEVIGSPVTDRLKSELAQFDFNEFQATSDGFRALRAMPIADGG